MPPVGQKGWKHVDLIVSRRSRQPGSYAPNRCNLHDALSVRAENDDALAVPGTAEHQSPGFANILRRCARKVDFLQHISCLKRDQPAVWGPEDRWRGSVFRARQRARFKRIQCTNPYEIAAVQTGGNEGQPTAIGRKRERATACRQGDLEAHWLGHWRCAAEIQERDRRE